MSRFCFKNPSRSDGYHGISVDKDCQLNILFNLKKEYIPWIQLNEIPMIRVVHPNFEILDIWKADLKGRLRRFPRRLLSSSCTRSHATHRLTRFWQIRHEVKTISCSTTKLHCKTWSQSLIKNRFALKIRRLRNGWKVGRFFNLLLHFMADNLLVSWYSKTCCHKTVTCKDATNTVRNFPAR